MPQDNNGLFELIYTRQILKQALYDYLYKNKWLEITASTITSLTGSCETIETVFILPFFDRRAHLAQTAQLQLERMVKLLQCKVWTWDHSFRKEPRVTPRHLVEFNLLELESPNFKLSDIMATKEKLLQYCINWIDKSDNLPLLLSKRMDYLKKISFPLPVCEYSEAVRILSKSGMIVNEGDNLGMKEEIKLLEYFNQHPFFLIHYPAEIKYFNMKRMTDSKCVYSVDLIAPPFGEISGGAEREDDFQRVEKTLRESKMWADIHRLGLDEDHFEWYLDLWKDGSPGPRGGFGIGFERLVGLFTGLNDIRQCTEFVRNRNEIFP